MGRGDRSDRGESGLMPCRVDFYEGNASNCAAFQAETDEEPRQMAFQG